MPRRKRAFSRKTSLMMITNNACSVEKKVMRSMNVIRSHHHEIYDEVVKKVALRAKDDERVITNNGICTLAYGYYLATETSYTSK